MKKQNDFTTLSQLLAFQAATYNNKTALNFKQNGELRSFSNQDLFDNCFYFAVGLQELATSNNIALQPTLAIFAYQDPIWMMVDLGTILAGGVTVPIFDNISKEHLIYELQDSAAEFLFLDKEENLSDECIKELNKTSIKKIITYNFAPQKLKNTTSFEELILLGKKAIKEKNISSDFLVQKSQPQDLATIIYTSGSTGKPKGVEITHENLVAQIHSTHKAFHLFESDKALSFLPLAHIFERMVSLFYISSGISVYFCSDTKNIATDLKEVQPNLMTVVPRVLEKIFLRIKENVEQASFLRKLLAQAALQRALIKDPKSNKTVLDKIYHNLVYKKFCGACGGKMRMIICGSSALSMDLQRFYQNIGLNVLCGYGLTEAAPVLATNTIEHNKIGTIGKAFPDVELKIAGDGELLGRGKNIMRGYHNNLEKTKEDIVDGWLKTGDLATIDNEGFVTIAGRKKEMFKTANGKYVIPTPIEQMLIQNLGFLLGAMIVADGKKFVSALLFPDFEILEKFKKKFSFTGSNEEFLQSKALRIFANKEISKINQSLDHWQQIQKFQIILQPISIATGEITPSMKLKRNILEEKFQQEIEKFYQE